MLLGLVALRVVPSAGQVWSLGAAGRCCQNVSSIKDISVCPNAFNGSREYVEHSRWLQGDGPPTSTLHITSFFAALYVLPFRFPFPEILPQMRYATCCPINVVSSAFVSSCIQQLRPRWSIRRFTASSASMWNIAPVVVRVWLLDGTQRHGWYRAKDVEKHRDGGI